MGKTKTKRDTHLIVKLFSPAKSTTSDEPSRSTVWRAKLRAENPERFEELQKQDRDRKRKQYHLDQSNDSRDGRHKRKVAREKNTIRQRQCRARHKAATDAEMGAPDKTKEKRSRKEYMREYMRKRRQNLSRQKKQALKSKDKQRKQKLPAGPQSTSTPNKASSSGYTRAGRRRKVKQLQPNMPGSPLKFADVVESLVDSCTPKKKKILTERGLLLSKEMRRKNMLLHSLGEETRRLSTICNQDGSIATRVIRSSKNQCIANIIRKKYRHRISWSYASNQLGVHWRQKTNCMKTAGNARPSIPIRQRRRDATPKEVEERVATFYRSPGISQTRPDKKLGRAGQPTYIMQKSFLKAYTEWKKENPQTKLGFVKFHQLKPKNVKSQSHMQQVACLCVYCVNIKEKLNTVNSKISHMLSTPDVESNIQAQLKSCMLSDETEYYSMLLCEKSSSNRFHLPECVQGNCEICGDLQSRILKFYHSFISATGPDKLTWVKWELKRITLLRKNSGKVEEVEVTRRVLSNKEGSAQELIEDLVHDTVEPTVGKTFVSHLFTASWQIYQVEKVLKEAVKKEAVPGLVMMIQDFGRNFSAKYQNEIKSAHWVKKEVTVHPIVTYYTDPNTKRYTRESLIFLSDDLTHDHHLVAKFLDVANDHLRRVRGLDPKMQIQVNDGCTNQYKKAVAFVDVSFGEEDYGCTIERSFYGSEHGKGEADGETSVVKGLCERAILTRQAVIDNAESMFNFCQKNLSLMNEDKGIYISRRSFFLVRRSEMIHNRPERSEGVKTVRHTRQIHSVRSVSPFEIQKRNLSCFCVACLKGETETCQNLSYAGSWTHVHLKPTILKKKRKVTEQKKDKATVIHQQKIVSSSALEATNTAPIKRKSIVCGDYVAIPLLHLHQKDRTDIYIACVAKQTKDMIEVKFMQRADKEGCSFIWPSGAKGEQLYTHPEKDVLHILRAPSVSMKGRALHYTFLAEDIESVLKASHGKAVLK